MTFFYKFVFTTGWIGTFGSAALPFIDFGSPQQILENPERSVFPIVWILGSILLLVMCGPLKKVQLGDGFLHVSNYIRTIDVPISDISRVTERRWTNPRRIRVEFRHETPFGTRIYFLPTVKFWPSMSHPVCRELNDLVRRAQEGPV